MIQQTKTTWRKVKLEEVVEIIDGDRGTNYPGNGEFFKDGYCLFLNAKNVCGTGFDFNDVQFINKEKDDLLRSGKMQRGDFVLTTRGTVGNIAHYNKEVFYDYIRINSGMVILRTKEDTINEKFFYLFLISQEFKNQIEALKSGSAQPQLPIRDLKFFEVNIPSLDKQEKIVKILYPIGDKIELNNKINQNLEQMAQAIFKEWFSAKDDKLLKDWKIGQLGDGILTSVISNGIDKFSGEKIYLATADVNGKEISNTTTKIKYNKRPSRADMQPVINSAWFAKMINTYKVLFFFDGNKKDLNKFILSTGFMGIKCNSGSEFYIYLLVSSKKFHNLKDTLVQGAVQEALTLGNIKRVEILIPPKEILEKFNLMARSLFNKIYNNYKENQKLASLRDLLLPKLMSGELQVNN